MQHQKMSHKKIKYFSLSLSCKYTYKTHELVLRARFFIKLLFYLRKSSLRVYFHLKLHYQLK